MIRTSEQLVCFATDQATSSGWCIHVGTSPVRHGVALTAVDRQDAVRVAHDYAMEHSYRNSLPWFVFVFENHAGFARKNGAGHATLVGALHRWLEHLDLLGHPARLRIGVTPNTWQRAVLGVRNSKVKSLERKAQALRWASNHTRTLIESSDQADAIALGAYGALHAERLIAQRALTRR